MSRRAAPTLSSKSALAPRFRGRPRPCQRPEIGRDHSPPHPTYLGGESPSVHTRYGGRGGPCLRPRVQGGAVRWTFKVPPRTRYLGKVPWQGGTWHVDLAFTIICFYTGSYPKSAARRICHGTSLALATCRQVLTRLGPRVFKVLSGNLNRTFHETHMLIGLGI